MPRGASRDRMKEIGPKKGEVRNPTGRNGWDTLRERMQGHAGETGEAVLRKMSELALEGDVHAARLVLGPIWAQRMEHDVPEELLGTLGEMLKAVREKKGE